MLELLPGMMNQGDLVGNRKGPLFSGTQNGAAVPSGMPNLPSGTIVPVAASFASGKAFLASLGTNGIRKDDIHFITYVKFYVTHN